VPLHAQLERLQPAERQPAVEWRRHRAGRVLQELHRLEHRRFLREHRALDHVGMSGQIFRHAVDNEVRAERERLLEERRRERVVDDQQRSGRMRGGGDRRDVIHQQARVRRRLDPDEPRFGRQRGFERARARQVDLPDAAAERLEHFVEDPVGAAVDVERDDDLVARLQVRLEDGVLGRESGPERRAVLHTFELGEYRLEPRTRRVVGARVVEAPVHARFVLLVGRGLEDRGDQRPGFRL
jgi:hypothetical protein